MTVFEQKRKKLIKILGQPKDKDQYNYTKKISKKSLDPYKSDVKKNYYKNMLTKIDTQPTPYFIKLHASDDKKINQPKLYEEFENREKSFILENEYYDITEFKKHLNDFIKENPYFEPRFYPHKQASLFSKIMNDSGKIVESREKLSKAYLDKKRKEQIKNEEAEFIKDIDENIINRTSNPYSVEFFKDSKKLIDKFRSMPVDRHTVNLINKINDLLAIKMNTITKTPLKYSKKTLDEYKKIENDLNNIVSKWGIDNTAIYDKLRTNTNTKKISKDYMEDITKIRDSLSLVDDSYIKDHLDNYKKYYNNYIVVLRKFQELKNIAEQYRVEIIDLINKKIAPTQFLSDAYQLINVINTVPNLEEFMKTSSLYSSDITNLEKKIAENEKTLKQKTVDKTKASSASTSLTPKTPTAKAYHASNLKDISVLIEPIDGISIYYKLDTGDFECLACEVTVANDQKAINDHSASASHITNATNFITKKIDLNKDMNSTIMSKISGIVLPSVFDAKVNEALYENLRNIITYQWILPDIPNTNNLDADEAKKLPYAKCRVCNYCEDNDNVINSSYQKQKHFYSKTHKDNMQIIVDEGNKLLKLAIDNKYTIPRATTLIVPTSFDDRYILNTDLI